jgi:hypothetical protein
MRAAVAIPAPAPAIDNDDPLEGVDWSAGWGSDAATRMFAAVREYCGVPPLTGPEPLTPEIVQDALADARAVLDGLDDVVEEEPIEDEIDGYDIQSFREACRHADAKGRRKPVDQHIERLRRLTEPDVTLERAWSETNHPWRIEGRAAESVVEALMMGLRERGVAALAEPDVRRRLRELDENQVFEVGDRLQRLKPEIARPWTIDEVKQLLRSRR